MMMIIVVAPKVNNNYRESCDWLTVLYYVWYIYHECSSVKWIGNHLYFFFFFILDTTTDKTSRFGHFAIWIYTLRVCLFKESVITIIIKNDPGLETFIIRPALSVHIQSGKCLISIPADKRVLNARNRVLDPTSW